MHNLIICDLCNGKKVVIGLGMLQDKCTACNGIGYVERNEEKTISPKLEESQERKKNPAKPKKSKLHNN